VRFKAVRSAPTGGFPTSPKKDHTKGDVMKRKLFWLIVGLAGATLAAILFLTKDLDEITTLTDENYWDW